MKKINEGCGKSVCTRKALMDMNERLRRFEIAESESYSIINSDVVDGSGLPVSVGKETFSVVVDEVSVSIHKVDFAAYLKYRSVFISDETNIGYPIDGDINNIEFSNISYINTDTKVSDNKVRSLNIENESQKAVVKFFTMGNRIEKDGSMFDKFNNVIVPNPIRTSDTYPSVFIARKSIPIHRLQAYAKYGKAIFQKKNVVRHYNDDRRDYSFDNIVIGSHQDNMADKVRNSGFYETQQEVVLEFLSSKSISRTARNTKQSESFVYRALSDSGVDWKLINKDVGHLSEKTINDMKLLISSGVSQKVVAKDLKVSVSTVSRYTSEEASIYRKKMIEKIERMLETDIKQANIARLFGVSGSFVSSVKAGTVMV